MKVHCGSTSEKCEQWPDIVPVLIKRLISVCECNRIQEQEQEKTQKSNSQVYNYNSAGDMEKLARNLPSFQKCC